jgi:hypothetical protein
MTATANRRTRPRNCSARQVDAARGLHPGARILIYVLSALVIPGLNFFQLALLSAVLAPSVAGRLAPLRTLFSRTRWLFLVMILAYAYSLPGEALLPTLGSFSPTREGGLQGLHQAWRLAILLLLLDGLVLRLERTDLLSGVYSLLRPFSRLGIEPDRVAVRLALTMEAMQCPGVWRGLRGMLREAPPETASTAEICLSMRPFRAMDWAALALMSLLVSAWLVASP